MVEFSSIADSGKKCPDMPWGGYDFEKKSRAVIAMGERAGAVLWTVGAHVRMEMEEAGLTALEDLGLEPEAEGIWVWEGRWVYTRDSYSLEYDSYPEGTFRAPTDEEWAAIREARCPWDDADWMICFCEQGTGCPKHEADDSEGAK
jgi:hypothetical protein